MLKIHNGLRKINNYTNKTMYASQEILMNAKMYKPDIFIFPCIDRSYNDIIFSINCSIVTLCLSQFHFTQILNVCTHSSKILQICFSMY